VAAILKSHQRSVPTHWGKRRLLAALLEVAGAQLLPPARATGGGKDPPWSSRVDQIFPLENAGG
jgi:hypothetical protein